MLWCIWETGVGEPSVDKRQPLAHVYGCMNRDLCTCVLIANIRSVLGCQLGKKNRWFCVSVKNDTS